MKKVLIFWIWFQWTKYINYFLNKWYLIDWVSKTWINKNNIYGLNSLYKSDIFFSNLCENTLNYDFIILSITPGSDLDNIINFLLDSNFTWIIIIEKPVSYDLNLLEKLYSKNNVYFFIDELILNENYKKIFNKWYEKIIFYLFSDNKENHTPILEHIFWWYLLNEDFNIILSNIKISFNKSLFHNNKLFYKIHYKDKYLLSFDSWNIKLNGNFIFNLNFWKSLEFILWLNLSDNQIYKKNFIYLRKYLINLLNHESNIYKK